MGEVFHVLEHSLGLCGEKHTSLIVMLLEWQNYSPILNYIKTIFK